MIWFALLPALLAQDPAPPVHSSQLTYQRPAVRPFEPPSDFGRETAQGDDTAGVWRRPLTAPVPIDAYRHSYEVSPTDAVIAYEQAVTQAELDYDARMIEGAEYDEWWACANEAWPDYAGYQTKTERQIPVFVLEEVAAA